MTGLDLLLGMIERGVRFAIDDESAVVAIDPSRVVSGPERVLLRAIRSEIRALLLTELPDDPGADVCEAFDAAEGVAACRRCARGIGEHFWRRFAPVCDFALGAVDQKCQRCGAAAAEHLAAQ
jgi:hypothetical protein